MSNESGNDLAFRIERYFTFKVIYFGEDLESGHFVSHSDIFLFFLFNLMILFYYFSLQISTITL